jgi:hypothetical protein
MQMLEKHCLTDKFKGGQVSLVLFLSVYIILLSPVLGNGSCASLFLMLMLQFNVLLVYVGKTEGVVGEYEEYQ